MSAITIDNLEKIYPPAFPRLRKFFRLKTIDPVSALRGVSLEIKQGEIFGLIGNNGAGKTTLTKIIATLVQPTNGFVTVGGFDSVNEDVRVRSLIGLATTEERSFYWRLTCRQNLLFFSRLYGMEDKPAARRIDELFEWLELTKLSGRRFSDLSTGNKQRLAFARALIPNPPILLLDEPTRSLDPIAAAKMRDIIRSLEGVSILLTSHNLSEIEELCERVAVISKGKIRAMDTPKKLRSSQKQVEQVLITIRKTDSKQIQALNSVTRFEYETRGENQLIRFERELSDNILQSAVRCLDEAGAQIVDIETDKSTLLDVLESYQDE